MSAGLGPVRVGESVQVTGGVPDGDGRPYAVIRAVHPASGQVDVQLYHDRSGRTVGVDQLRRFGEQPGRPWVIVGCGATKLDRPAPAGKMYVGSYHLAARRAATALTDRAHTLIVSALYGLLRLDDVIEPYDMAADHPAAVTSDTLELQAGERRLSVLDRCVLLAGSRYEQLCRPVWPYLQAPLAGTRGIGEQMARLAALARGEQRWVRAS